jgi:hypothetical protein
MPGEADANALRARLRAIAISMDPESRTALHAEVNCYVDQMKARGWPCEEVVVAVKRLAHEAGLRPSVATAVVHEPDARERTIAELVAWCIKRYYPAS